jgi:pantoate--beta-alanine ligase
MRLITAARDMQHQALRWRQAGVRVAFVPTMGFLHAGHVSLIKKARKLAGPKGKVVVSIYVNPAQFAPTEDLAQYPRDLVRDKKLCGQAGTDVLFAPADKQVYPRGYSTWVVEEHLSRSMEGASRPTHFRGVTTVVAKLLNIVQPEIAVFGAKDFQQAAVVRKMVDDLNFPVKIVVAPTVRERDGLAMSSRNKYLQGDLRVQAAVLSQAIAKARALARETPAAETLRKELRAFIERQPAARVDYIEFFDADTLEKVEQVGPRTHMALAVFVGSTRLIDNATLNGREL